MLNIDEVDKAINPLIKRNEILVTIDAEGKLYIDSDNPISPDKESIKKAILRQQNYIRANIVIYTDANAPHQTFVTIVATLSEMGIDKISIATQ